MKTMTSKEMADAQRARDRKHHAERVEWLSQPNPKYSDGTPVAKIDVINWLSVSRFILENPSHGYNTGPKE